MIAAETLRERLARGALLSVGAFALALAFPRTDWDGAAWLALVPLLVVALGRQPRSAFAWGWLYGTVFFLILLRWLDFTFRVYSAVPWPVTWLPILLLAAYCGLYVAAVAWALARIARARGGGLALLAAPALWVGAEWLRGVVLGGFPWGNLGYAQYLRLPVIQVAELGGVWAVSFLVVAVNAALAGCLVLTWRGAVAGLVLAGLLLGGTLAFGAQRLAEPAPSTSLSIAVVQPSIEQPLKFDPGFASASMAIYTSLTRQAAAGRPDLIVWPETALPGILGRDRQLKVALEALTRSAGTPLLVGALAAHDTSQLLYSNSAFLLTERGIAGRYDKIHLVPFGEFIPLPAVIGFVRRWAEFVSELEPGRRPVVFEGPPAPFGVVICYEGIFPALVRRFVNGGARLVVNMTNDAWFGRTSGPWQHLAMYSFRAVEHRTTVVRAANTGVSAFIAPTGQIVRRLPLFQRGVALEVVALRTRRTLYTRWGDWLPALALAASAAGLGATLRRRRA